MASGGPEEQEPARELDRRSAELLAALEAVEHAETSGERSRAFLRFATLLADRTRRLGARLIAGGRPLADIVIELAPHLPVRDAVTLHEHFPGLSDDALADALVRNASRGTTAVGVAGGSVAAMEWAAIPTLAAIPLQVLAETVAVALIEVKLVAELHAVYGATPEGSRTQRGLAYVMSWAQRRGADPTNPTALPVALGIAGRRTIAHRLGARLARNLGTLAPMFVGAAIGGVWNRSETRKLATSLRSDLRPEEGHLPSHR